MHSPFLRWPSQWSLHWRLRRVRRKVGVLEEMELPEDLKRAAIRRLWRRFEERLDSFTRS